MGVGYLSKGFITVVISIAVFNSCFGTPNSCQPAKKGDFGEINGRLTLYTIIETIISTDGLIIESEKQQNRYAPYFSDILFMVIIKVTKKNFRFYCGS